MFFNYVLNEIEGEVCRNGECITEELGSDWWCSYPETWTDPNDNSTNQELKPKCCHRAKATMGLFITSAAFIFVAIVVTFYKFYMYQLLSIGLSLVLTLIGICIFNYGLMRDIFDLDPLEDVDGCLFKIKGAEHTYTPMEGEILIYVVIACMSSLILEQGIRRYWPSANQPQSVDVGALTF